MKPDTPLRWTPREQLLAAATCALFAATGLALGLPQPASDDLMFSGAAISLATGGGLRNPLLATQFGTAEFLVYPPFYFELLGGWLRLTGVTTWAMLLFQQAAYAIAGIALTVWLRRRRLVGSLPWVWPAIFAGGLLAGLGQLGLRPDATGLAALLVGVVLRDAAATGWRFTGWLLIGGSMLISPHMLVVGTGLVLGQQLLDEPHRSKPVAEWKYVLSAAALLFVLFLLSIGGRLGEFLEALQHHASRTSMHPLVALGVCLDHWSSNVGRAFAVVALGVTLAAAALAVARGAGRTFFAALFVTAATITTSGVLDVAVHHLRLTLVILWTLACAAWLLTCDKRLSWTPVVAAIVALVWDMRADFGALGPRGRPDPAQIQEVIAMVAREPQRRYLIDPFAARHVFDYRLPSNARNWTFGRPFPRMWPGSLGDLQPDETWIISGYNLCMIEPDSAPPLETIFTLFGRSLTRRSGDYTLHMFDGRSPVRSTPAQ